MCTVKNVKRRNREREPFDMSCDIVVQRSVSKHFFQRRENHLDCSQEIFSVRSE